MIISILPFKIICSQSGSQTSTCKLVERLAYRSRRHPDLDPTTYGLTLWDLDRTFPTDGLGGTERATLRQIFSRLREAYCRTVGLEYTTQIGRASCRERV